MMAAMRRYLMAGLAVSAPILITFLVVDWLIELSDHALNLLPAAYHPEVLLGMHVPGMGVLLALVVLVGVGAFATNFIGKHTMLWFDAVLDRVPVVRSLYGAIKQLMDAVLGNGSSAFRQVVLVPFPQQGQWTIGFVTGESSVLIAGEEAKVPVFVATTPIPTSGWLLFVSESDLVVLDMSVEEGMKIVVSGGMISPKEATRLNAEPTA